jgi:Meckel syndrome type 1 protein
MERAERLAANPMKVILQASKIRRKADPAADAAEASAARPTGRAAEAPAAVAAVAATAALPSRDTAPLTRSISAAVTEEAQAKKMPASLLPAPPAAAVPAIDAAPARMEAVPAIAKALAPQRVPLVALPVRPTLVTMVEPDIPVRLLSDSGRVNEVMADLTLRPDGSVGAVALVSPVPRSWRAYITAALERWRFEPLPDALVHRVQLVFDEK